MKEIKITLTIEETNQILDALGNQPFKSVFGLINRIQSQAALQLQENGRKAEMPELEVIESGITEPAAN